MTLDRRVQIERLRREAFDIVVIGGGITGAAAARDAARRGFRTALVEARDFAEGTSSRSSRLIHGGLRYLEQFEFDLVFEASQERRTLLDIAPHLVRPLEFVFPIYESGRVGKLKLDAGMWLYDALSLFRNIERHQMLDADEVLEREPGLLAEGLLGGARYFDAQVDDARLVLTTVDSAVAAGAAAANRLEVVEILVDRDSQDGPMATGVKVRDEDGGEWPIWAPAVLNATGPWADITLERAGTRDQELISPTRGSHVHVSRRKLPHQSALILESPVDGRIMFVLPWGELSMIGTTDDFYEGPPEDVVATAGDVTYLLESANALFPEADLDVDDVLSAWAGLRPLVMEEGASEGEVSREFVIREDPRGLFTIAGGKLTSHRSMAEELIDDTRDYLRKEHDIKPRRKASDTDRVPLAGGDFESLDELCERLRPEAEARGLSARTADWLARAHGTRYHRILDLIDDDPDLAVPIVEDRPYLAADVVYAAQAEMAVHAEDVLYRRTHVGLETREFDAACRKVVDVMAGALGWDAERCEAERKRAHAIRAANRAYRKELGQ